MRYLLMFYADEDAWLTLPEPERTAATGRIGVAGLQAIGTARRLGAVVRAYDVRPETREQAESLGAQFVKLKTTIDATGAGGYARELTPEERAAQQAELNEVIGGMDIVITTAQVPGRKPPVLVTADAVGRMKPASVCSKVVLPEAEAPSNARTCPWPT